MADARPPADVIREANDNLDQWAEPVVIRESLIQVLAVHRALTEQLREAKRELSAEKTRCDERIDAALAAAEER